MINSGKVRLKRGRQNRIIMFGWVILLSFCVSFFIVYQVSERLTPTLLVMAEAKLNKFSTLIVNNAVSQILDDRIETNSLFSLTRSSTGEIQLIDFDPVAVNHILNVATTVVQDNIRLLEEGDLASIGLNDLNLSRDELESLKEGIVVSVPTGKATNITFLTNLGPKIPIRFHYIGDVNGNITTKLTQYGLNNALIEIGVQLEMTAQLYLPFSTSVKFLQYDIPIIIKMVQGTVPNFYSNGLLKNSSLYSKSIEE